MQDYQVKLKLKITDTQIDGYFGYTIFEHLETKFNHYSNIAENPAINVLDKIQRAKALSNSQQGQTNTDGRFISSSGVIIQLYASIFCFRSVQERLHVSIALSCSIDISFLKHTQKIIRITSYTTMA